jgi:hypothetical protein
MKEGTTLGAKAQPAIQRAAVLYKPRLATFYTDRGTSMMKLTAAFQNFATAFENDIRAPV